MEDLGLAADEFTDNDHRPYEIYAREARRIVGRYVFTQLDGSLPDDLDRASVHADSVGVTEWYFDTHACTTRRVPGSMHEGKMMLHESTFPGQVPYRCLLPQGLDNLLVLVCLSSTHVAWGTIRLEPTWMNIVESAAYAARLAKDQGITPAEIDTDTWRQFATQDRETPEESAPERNAGVSCRRRLGRLYRKAFRCPAAVAFRQVRFGQECRERLPFFHNTARRIP